MEDLHTPPVLSEDALENEMSLRHVRVLSLAPTTDGSIVTQLSFCTECCNVAKKVPLLINPCWRNRPGLMALHSCQQKKFACDETEQGDTSYVSVWRCVQILACTTGTKSCRFGSKSGHAGLSNSQTHGLNYGLVNKSPSAWGNKLPLPSYCLNQDREICHKMPSVHVSPLVRDWACHIQYIHPLLRIPVSTLKAIS